MYFRAQVPSNAYTEWDSTRRSRFDELLDAHSEMGGKGPGRRWRTEQVNWALVVRLTGEFQGFSRDLHDEASEALSVRAAPVGFELWPSLKSKDVQNDLRQQRLKALVEARNAISHSNPNGLARLEADGYPIDLRTIRRWLSSLHGLALNMDDVIADQIALVVGGPPPW
jgi:hypothetical protein